MKKLIIFFILCFAGLGKASVTSIEIEGHKYSVASIEKGQMLYASATEIGKAYKAELNFGPGNDRIYIKFRNGSLSFTSGSAFIILKEGNRAGQTLQMPLETIKIKGNIFVPLIYSMKYFTSASGKRLSHGKPVAEASQPKANPVTAGAGVRSKNSLLDKWAFNTIVLDAGHGGKDAGAIGCSGTKEKTVNLGIVLRLGKMIEKEFRDVRVVYTRDSDYFVELYKRGKIANEHRGKLFISFHCNSTPQKPTRSNGFEVYLLRPGRTKEAIRIAEFENSVIRYEKDKDRYSGINDESFILTSMAHSSYMRYSEVFADFLTKDLGIDSPIPARGVKQAGFYVLVGASMPSVLVETGFLSNPDNEKYLASAKGQTEIAEKTLEAIRTYRDYYQKMIAGEIQN